MSKGTGVRDVSSHDFVKRYAAHLKQTAKIEVPEWSDHVKLGIHKELAPYDRDWFYTRAASVARHIYLRPGVGVGALTTVYGGAKNRGVLKSFHQPGSSSVARAVLKALEKAGILEKDKTGGRRITQNGQRDLDNIAMQILDPQRGKKKL